MKQAAETTMRVPHELKEELNELKGKLYVTTPHEAVRKLIVYHSKSEQEKIDLKAYQDAKMLDVGENMKRRFQEVKEDLGLRTDGAVLEFLIENYQGSLQLGMGAFETYKRLRGQGK
ncbi:hypothetical protein [Paenibacillus macerans]|uniref:hypothetical protein n=1 Tax=Paenibacillus macerans TaxID=44252 RepID=UPI000EE53E36|nr:hypothetical protein [Paenibacillus macerans]GBK66272.1 hypothetical protein PbDSM24746_62760 [Paenibacillus macerans]GBK72554.1 hypothetical protein PbJCM17693_62620 [Paenibacillus macerans]